MSYMAVSVSHLLQRLTLLVLVGAVNAKPMPPCDTSKNGQALCSDFCNYRCSFYNTSIGETGMPTNITLYRITPSNVTGIRNKDTGDAPGDVGFFLGKKNLTRQCALYPTSMGCFLDGDDIYGKFVVEVDGQYGPYSECNPTNMDVKADGTVGWIDTRNFQCGQGCLDPTVTGCHGWHWPGHPPQKPRNGTTGYGDSIQCFCDGTKRHTRTVGREKMPYGTPWYVGPDYWQPQCKVSYYEYWNKTTNKYGGCVDGKRLSTVSGESFAVVSARACDACSADGKCTGWRTVDNKTATLLQGPLFKATEKCIGGEKWVDSHGGGGGGWGSAGHVGGNWYNTPMSAECAAAKPLGTDGCTWRVVARTYRNASCVDGLIDTAVERHGAACFKTCAIPLDRIGDCYLRCYRNTLLGDAGYGIAAMTKDQIVGPWEKGFDDEAQGGCPNIMPRMCHGPQCG